MSGAAGVGPDVSPAFQAEAGLDEGAILTFLPGPMNFLTFLTPTQALAFSDPQSLAHTFPHVLQERRALERKAAELEEELKVNMLRHCGLWASPAQGHQLDSIPSHRPCPTSGLTTNGSRMRTQP